MSSPDDEPRLEDVEWASSFSASSGYRLSLVFVYDGKYREITVGRFSSYKALCARLDEVRSQAHAIVLQYLKQDAK